jgi:2-methylcitrate dehydratase PrpD
MTIAADIAARCLALDYPDLPADVADRVKYLLLDHLGVAARGARIESSAPVHRYLGRTPAPANGVPVIGTGLTAEASAAALANGIAAHAPEMDDVVNAASLHPAVCVMPAALSAAHLTGAGPRELIAAIACGYEVMVKLGVALDPAAHYARGFHPTGTCGVFGAAIAAAKLLGLDRAQMVNALGIAGSQAAGLLEFLSDGTYTKRFHAGWGAHSGLMAALLARDGFTGPATVIEGRFGFLKAYSPGSDPGKVLAGWGAPLEVMRTSIKPHACCRYKQGPIDCILRIVRENKLTADDIQKVTVAVLQAGFALVADPPAAKARPVTVVDAQFSMPFGAAVAILKASAFLDEYSLANIRSPEVQRLMQLVECAHDPEIEPDFPRKWPAKVEILTRDGRRLAASVEFPKGDPENLLSWEELIEKFHRLTTVVYGEAQRERIVARVRALETAPDILELMRLTLA